jgi:hypothetical protein
MRVSAPVDTPMQCHTIVCLPCIHPLEPLRRSLTQPTCPLPVLLLCPPPPSPGYSASQPLIVGTLYFLSITFSGAVYINLLACLWFLTARLQGFSNSWLQSVNDEDLSGGCAWCGVRVHGFDTAPLLVLLVVNVSACHDAPALCASKACHMALLPLWLGLYCPCLLHWLGLLCPLHFPAHQTSTLTRPSISPSSLPAPNRPQPVQCAPVPGSSVPGGHDHHHRGVW